MTFIPIAGPADTFSRIPTNPDRCWGDGEGGHGSCGKVVVNAIGLCDEHLERYREALP
jgi:hypothetical protein